MRSFRYVDRLDSCRLDGQVRGTLPQSTPWLASVLAIVTPTAFSTVQLV